MINLIILSSHLPAIAQTDEILKKVKEFVQNQEKILPQYTASVSATLLVEGAVIEGEGNLSFKPPDIYKEDIGTATCYVGGNLQPAKEQEGLKKFLEPLPISPFDIYEIFLREEDYELKYIKEENNLYLFRIIPKKGCEEPLKGQIGIDKTEFAITFADVELDPPNFVVFSVKVKIKASFKKINDKYWLPYETITDSTTRVLFKKIKMNTKRTYSNFKVNEVDNW